MQASEMAAWPCADQVDTLRTYVLASEPVGYSRPPAIR